MDIRRFQQVVQYGWKDAKSIGNQEDINKGRISIFLDILYSCFLGGDIFSASFWI